MRRYMCTVSKASATTTPRWWHIQTAEGPPSDSSSSSIAPLVPPLRATRPCLRNSNGVLDSAFPPTSPPKR